MGVEKSERSMPALLAETGKTARNGALEISTSPMYGVYISKIKKIAHKNRECGDK